VVRQPDVETKERIMDSVFLEIRAAEGGADARQLVGEQLKIYTRRAARSGL
jgi:protein subunit release factor A